MHDVINECPLPALSCGDFNSGGAKEKSKCKQMLYGSRTSTTTGHAAKALASIPSRIWNDLNLIRHGSSRFNCPIVKRGSKDVSRTEQSEASLERPRLIIGLTKLLCKMNRSTHLDERV